MRETLGKNFAVVIIGLQESYGTRFFSTRWLGSLATGRPGFQTLNLQSALRLNGNLPSGIGSFTDTFIR